MNTNTNMKMEMQMGTRMNVLIDTNTYWFRKKEKLSQLLGTLTVTLNIT